MKHVIDLARFALLLFFAGAAQCLAAEDPALRAGAATVDISPETLPALQNGGFLQRSANRVLDPLHARSLVISDGKETIAIVIVDSCMFPTTLCDEIKRLASKETGIPTDRILISATHTHSAPSAMTCLGCAADEAYVQFGRKAGNRDRQQHLLAGRGGQASNRPATGYRTLEGLHEISHARRIGTGTPTPGSCRLDSVCS